MQSQCHIEATLPDSVRLPQTGLVVLIKVLLVNEDAEERSEAESYNKDS